MKTRATYFVFLLVAAMAVQAIPAPAEEARDVSSPTTKFEGTCIPGNSGGKRHHSRKGQHSEWLIR
ncbi:hypothetical protein BDV29DRAFT_159888 [Aspergillus leporis]|uniref:Uncharacterized protein n=1 Tax=Aspergillus leporis TaxID=41062 RepID=A0A5N5WVA2_9EURO|nr:hypothetical protein BDV29DRAFT_159888 [Aspergillus leporis]